MRPITTRLTLMLLATSCAGAALAAPIQIPKKSPDLVPANPSHIRKLNPNAVMPLPMLSDGEVGDADSFGSKVTYVGLLGTGDVYLLEDCSTVTLGPNDRCVTLNPQPAQTSFDFDNLGTITLPAKSTQDLLCFATTALRGWDYFNETAGTAFAQFHYNIVVKVSNALLDDPSLIDPTTGMPFNGQLTVAIGEDLLDAKSMPAGASETHQAFASRTCQAGALSKDALSLDYGLPDTIVNKFFKQPITLSIGVEGSAALVGDATILAGIRFYGD